MEAALRGEELGELDDLVGDERVPLLALRRLLEDDELLDEVEQLGEPMVCKVTEELQVFDVPAVESAGCPLRLANVCFERWNRYAIDSEGLPLENVVGVITWT